MKNNILKIIICVLLLVFILFILSIFRSSANSQHNAADNVIEVIYENLTDNSLNEVEVATEEPLVVEVEEPEIPAIKSFDEVFSYNGLIELKEVDPSFVLDIKNATTDNITGKVQYDQNLCLINIDAAKALVRAQELAMADGYRLKIWDAYRPRSVQAAMNASLPADKKHFVPAPSSTSQHCRGIAIDVTLVDANGIELEMPTDYCEFGEATYPNYTGATKTQTKNREYLKSIMKQAGFKVLSVEWWHYYLPTYKNYKQLDFKFTEFLTQRGDI